MAPAILTEPERVRGAGGFSLDAKLGSRRHAAA
jgi:hypothetical protein